jgi:hypothetical protein
VVSRPAARRGTGAIVVPMLESNDNGCDMVAIDITDLAVYIEVTI